MLAEEMGVEVRDPRMEGRDIKTTSVVKEQSRHIS